MKKFLICIICLIIFILVGCSEKINYEDQSFEVYVGDSITLGDGKFVVDLDILQIEANNNELVEINDINVTAKKAGEVEIVAKNKKKGNVAFTTSIKIKDIEIQCADSLFEKEKIALNINCNKEVVWSLKDTTLATISGNELTGVKKGKVVVVAKVNGIEITKEIEVKRLVDPIIVTNLSDSLTIEENGKIEFSAKIEPTEDYELEYVLSKEGIISIADNTINALSIGEVVLTIQIKNENIKKDINVKVVESMKPEFKFDSDYKEEITLNYGKTLDATIGLKVIDNVDGDITSKVEVSEFNNTEYGKQTIELTATDSSGNTSKITRTVNVIWNYTIKFIGHAGSYYGLMNSEEAFIYGVKNLHYQALECDLKQTSDGVFVLSHDNDFAGYDIASTSWDVLKDVTKTASRTAGIPGQNGSVTKSSYTTKLCTLERYLDICKEYNAIAVIELKASSGITNSDQSRMQALMDIIEEKGMRENVIFLGSQYNCLIWTRNNGYSDIECQYLVNSCEDETILQRCIDNDLDISINVTATYSNSDEWLARYKEQGIKISTYTYTQYVDYDVVQEWIDKDVDFVTCDWHLMEKLNLTESTKDENAEYTVKFYDSDKTLLKEVKVKAGKTAAAPKNPSKEGYEFAGWDKIFRNVQSDLEVVATYKKINYEVIFDLNLDVVTKTSWESKDAFTTELYTDMYNWFVKHGNSLDGVTVTGNSVTITKNGQTATFASADELKAIDIYVFEKTVSNYMFKEVVRNSDDTCVIEPSESYFFNCDEFRIKYQEMDQYLINCINTTYTSYNKTYKPTSAGKIQIFFRFHQWQKGTNIAAFNTLPNKYVAEQDSRVQATKPSNITYTVEDEVTLPTITANVEFLGWYLDKECTKLVTKLEVGTTGNIILYAKWKLE